MILETANRRRRFFDVNNKRDVASAKYFFINHSWRNESGCPFILEYPFVSVPDMIRSKLTLKLLGIEYDPRRHAIGN
jgi:hypothetical protein